MHENAHKLIPELAQWNEGKGIDLESFANCIARYDHAAAYAVYFWPDFVLHDDCLFIGPHLENYKSWMAQCKGDRTGVEKVMNRRHILDMFVNSEFEPTRDMVIHLGRLLKDMWTCKLRRDFPDRQVTVEFFDGASDNLLDHIITVFQERQAQETR